MASEVKLPALKENVESVEVNAVKVAPGDTVAKDQPLLEVQAEKAALDVPSPIAGKVAKILVKPGDEVKVGQPYVIIEETDGKAAPKEKEEKKPEPKPAAEKKEEKKPAAEKKE